jgi:hypothetical protein
MHSTKPARPLFGLLVVTSAALALAAASRPELPKVTTSLMFDTPEADAIWKLVFDLYRVAGGQETQIVHVSFTTGAPVERKAVQAMASEGVTPAQANLLVTEVHPASKAIAGVKKPTKKQKQRLHDAMSKVVNVDLTS